jgi:hypothetical protein
MNFEWRQNAIGGLLDQGGDWGRFVERNTGCKRMEVGGWQHIGWYHNSKLKSMAIYCIRIRCLDVLVLPQLEMEKAFVR